MRWPIILSADAFYLMWTTEGFSTPHQALLPDYSSHNSDEGFDYDPDGAAARGRRDLGELGVIQGGRLDPVLGRAFHRIGRAPTEYYGYFTDSEGDYTVFVGVDERCATRVYKRNNQYRIDEVHPDQAVESLVMLLTEAPAGREPSLTFRAVDLTGTAPADEDSFYKDRVYIQRDVAPTPQERVIAKVRELMSRPRIGGGQFVRAGRDHHGKRVRGATPVTVIDIHQAGRFVVTTFPGPDRTEWVRIDGGAFDRIVTAVRAC